MTAVKSLLDENKKALQCLHYSMGYDFEKPYRIIEGTGKFTNKSLYKMLNDDEKANTVIILLVKPHSYITDSKLCYVYLTDKEGNWLGKFNNPFSCNDIGNFKGISYYYRKSDLETDRKIGVDKYFLVIQNKQYLTVSHKKKEIDFNERMTAVEPVHYRYGRHYVEYVVQGNTKYHINYYCTSLNPIDKSGYLVDVIHNMYKKRAKELIAKRKKEEVKAYNHSADIIKINIDMNRIRKNISSTILECQKSYELSEINDIFSYYVTTTTVCDRHQQRIKNNEYSSIEEIQKALDNIKTRIKSINMNLVSLKNNLGKG